MTLEFACYPTFCVVLRQVYVRLLLTRLQHVETCNAWMRESQGRVVLLLKVNKRERRDSWFHSLCIMYEVNIQPGSQWCKGWNFVLKSPSLALRLDMRLGFTQKSSSTSVCPWRSLNPEIPHISHHRGLGLGTVLHTQSLKSTVFLGISLLHILCKCAVHHQFAALIFLIITDYR